MAAPARSTGVVVGHDLQIVQIGKIDSRNLAHRGIDIARRIVASDGGINLHRYAEILQVAEAGDGGVEGSGNAAEAVVGDTVRSIKTDGDTLHAAIDDHARGLFADQGSVSRGHDAQAFFGAVTRELEDIGTIEWFSAAEQKNGTGDTGNLIDDAEP
jgi:hypothetical protein